MIHFSNADARVTLSGRRELKTTLAGLFKREGQRLHSLRFVFCSDPYLLKINQDFLHHDYYTDIITFQLGENPETIGVEGEVYISVERVRDNAREQGVALRQELLRVIFHGALHLCGYRDKTAGEQKSMRRKEDAYLKRVSNVPRRTVSR
jgi:probable rRNA maturation factor